MLKLVVRTLRLRKGGFAATFVAMLFGATIVLACGGLMETGIRTAVPAQRLAAAPIVVTGNQDYEIPREDPAAPKDPEDGPETEGATFAERVRVDENLVADIANVPGVAAAVPDVSFPVTVMGAESQGHGWESARLTPYSLTEGTAPKPGEVVLDARLAETLGAKPGGQVPLAVRGATETFRVAGIAAPQGNPSQLGVFFTGTEATRLAGHPGKIDAIGVFTAPGTDPSTVEPKVAGALHGSDAVALTGDDRGTAEFPETVMSAENLIVLAAVSGGLAAMVAMFVVAGTLALSLQQRQRELALLRALGTTPGQLRRMVLGETMIVAVLATGLSVLLGAFLSRWLFGRLVGNGVVPDSVAFHQGWIPVAAASGAALLAAIVAGLFAARRAASTRPTEALAEAAVRRRWLTPTRVVIATLCFGGGLALAIVTVAVMTGPIAASTAGPSVMLWAVGLAMLSPGLTRILTAILHWPVRAISGVNGRLALINSRARVVRMAAAVTPIMLATGIATANIYLQTTTVAEAEKAYTESLRADAVIASSTGGLPADLVGRIETLPGVAGASELVNSRVFVDAPLDDSQDEEGMPAQGVTAEGAAQTSAIPVTKGSLGDLRGDTVALPASYAAKLHRGIGDTVTLRMGDRAQVTTRVVALLNTKPSEDVFLLPAELLAPHTTAGLAPRILVRADQGVDKDRLAETLATATRGVPGVRVGDRDVLIAAHAKGQEIGAWVNYLMVGMIMAYTAISVVNTLVMATARRRREFGLQRLTGATRGQVFRMMSVEGLLVAVTGVVLGTVVAAAAIVPFTLVVSDSVLPSGPLWIYLAVLGVAGALTMSATLVPTWFATKGRPAEAAVADD